MPFGLTNAQQRFNVFMNKILSSCRHFVEIYLDDIAIHSLDINFVIAVKSLTCEQRLYCKLKKCEFCKTDIDNCGFHIDQNGACTQPDKIRQLQ